MAGEVAVTDERERHLAWEGTLNARDLGGYKTENGREICWGAIVRTDNLAPLTEAGQQALRAYGVRTIIDLRLPTELAEHPNPFASPGDHGITYSNISLVNPATKSQETFTTLANDYKHILDDFSPAIVQIMTTIAEATRGGVLVHCMGGKDRTGIVSALLLDLAGVSRETIGADYALTAEYLRPQEEEWLKNGPNDREWRERELALHKPASDVMQEVLVHLDDRYGGVEQYLLGAGVTRENLQELRKRLLGDTR